MGPEMDHSASAEQNSDLERGSTMLIIPPVLPALCMDFTNSMNLFEDITIETPSPATKTLDSSSVKRATVKKREKRIALDWRGLRRARIKFKREDSAGLDSIAESN